MPHRPPASPAATAAGQTTVPPAPTLPPGQPVLRVPTDADPLRVYVAGDSLVGGWGQALDNIAGNSTGIDVELDYEVSTGLVRTDYYNWPARLQQKIGELDPEVVILGFGGNDKQPIEGRDVLDPAWQAEYRKRVGAVMDYVNQNGRKLIWVGTPNYPEEESNAKFAVMNQIFKEEAARPAEHHLRRHVGPLRVAHRRVRRRSSPTRTANTSTFGPRTAST